MKRLILILTAAAIAMSGAVATATAKPETASTAPLTKAESTQLLNGLSPANEIAPRLKKIKASIQALQSPAATKQSQTASLNRGRDETVALDQALVRLRGGFDAVEQRIGSKGGQASVDANRAAIDALRSRFESAIKDLESKDKMGNFEIQDLMSTYNRAQTAASNVTRKLDETKNSITQNLR